jgi:hypothetical protein
MSEEMVQGTRIARGTALMTADRFYSAQNSREPRTEHWMLSITYYLNPKQVSDQSRIYPQYEFINPLGLTITEFHENRISVDPIKPDATAGGKMSYELILPFFPEELRELLLDPSISDLMINGTTGVFADRNGVVEQIQLKHPYTNERLQAAIERVARILGQDLTGQNPILNTRLPDGSRVAVVGPPSSINGPTFTVRKFNRWFTSDELIASGSLARQSSGYGCTADWSTEERHYRRWNWLGKNNSDESFARPRSHARTAHCDRATCRVEDCASQRRSLGGGRGDSWSGCRHSEPVGSCRSPPSSGPHHHGRNPR